MSVEFAWQTLMWTDPKKTKKAFDRKFKTKVHLSTANTLYDGCSLGAAKLNYHSNKCIATKRNKYHTGIGYPFKTCFVFCGKARKVTFIWPTAVMRCNASLKRLRSYECVLDSCWGRWWMVQTWVVFIYDFHYLYSSFTFTLFPCCALLMSDSPHDVCKCNSTVYHSH